MEKNKYRGLSNGRMYYCSAFTEIQAQRRLIDQAWRKTGRWDFTDFEVKREENWIRLSYGF
jgi:hypothetical protein